MSISILKFGGTSVANTDRLKSVAQIIKNRVLKGEKLAVVVSAMAGATNKLIEYCNEVSKLDKAEHLAQYDAALSSGELVTSALLSLCLQEIEINSISLQSWQIAINTTNNPSRALITSVDIDKIINMINQGVVPIIAGFQGINKDGFITTLGRGGSDTTAAAVAAALSANVCDIYTDVAGVYSTDPRIVSSAIKIDHINYDDMIEFSLQGAKVLHPRAVQIAKKYNIPIRVISTFDSDISSNNYTLISNKINTMESAHATGIAYNNNLALVSLRFNIKSSSVCLMKYIFEQSRAKSISFDSFNQYTESNILNLHITISLSDVSKFEEILSQIDGIVHNNINLDLVAVSMVGHYLKSDEKIINSVFDILLQNNIIVHQTFTSEHKITIFIGREFLDLVVGLLHKNLIDEKV